MAYIPDGWKSGDGQECAKYPSPCQYPSLFANNTLVFRGQNTAAYHDTSMHFAMENDVYGGKVRVSDKKKDLTIPEYQQKYPGMDKGTRVTTTLPSDDTLIQMAKKILKM
eukprot:NODE_2612_length_460_cov_490.754258_g2164_i0.p1 GENE.NODE_2612_length_460_cov_490.754258_g2164_i0~~NODE_2612_length_460_cov_490.754258_g2164_i0.p1  ORF type:complete len:110 (-),score=15.23 NODE_2612_length_460_cov_490.754258_g2164_i0:49-378(-)